MRRDHRRAAALPDAPGHVLLLHGMACGPWVWDAVRPALSPALVPIPATIAGHRGGRPLQRSAGRAASEQMVDDLERQLDELGIGRLHVVGNSLGGWIALRLSERGRALSVLCLAPAGGWQPGSVAERVLAARFVLGQRTARHLARMPHLLQHRSVRHTVLGPLMHDPGSISVKDAVTFVRDLAQCQALQSRVVPVGERRLGPIDHLGAPTTIAWSRDDRVLSDRWARTGFEHLGAREVTLPHVGHVPMLDDARLVATLITRVIEKESYAC